jgi:hypothetical protein
VLPRFIKAGHETFPLSGISLIFEEQDVEVFKRIDAVKEMNNADGHIVFI